MLKVPLIHEFIYAVDMAVRPYQSDAEHGSVPPRRRCVWKFTRHHLSVQSGRARNLVHDLRQFFSGGMSTWRDGRNHKFPRNAPLYPVYATKCAENLVTRNIKPFLGYKAPIDAERTPVWNHVARQSAFDQIYIESGLEKGDPRVRVRLYGRLALHDGRSQFDDCLDELGCAFNRIASHVSQSGMNRLSLDVQIELKDTQICNRYIAASRIESDHERRWTGLKDIGQILQLFELVSLLVHSYNDGKIVRQWSVTDESERADERAQGTLHIGSAASVHPTIFEDSRKGIPPFGRDNVDVPVDDEPMLTRLPAVGDESGPALQTASRLRRDVMKRSGETGGVKLFRK